MYYFEILRPRGTILNPPGVVPVPAWSSPPGSEPRSSHPGLLTLMFKLASSRPAQAVGTSDNRRRADGDGGRTAGTPPDGGEASGANGNHNCENLLRHASPGVHGAPTTSRRSRNRPARLAAQQSGSSDESGTSPSEPDSEAAPRRRPKLKPRTFRFGTWNMRGATDNTNSPKIVRAESYMAIEKIDVLVLTETHCRQDDTPPCRGSHLLAHTNLDEHRAGVAIITLKSSGWSSDHSLTLIPGRATLTHLHHRKSTESVWMLGIYADVSSPTNLKRFYQHTLVALVSFIQSYPSLAKSFSSWPADWPGCIAVGDWNMVEHADDRLPLKAPPAPLLRVVQDILAVCRAQDAAGPNAFPRGFTWSQARRGSVDLPSFLIHSRLDRIYIPTDTWSAGLPVSIPTNWSDHKLVWADCTVLTPQVEIAQSAPRLPNLRCFKNSPQFWKTVMEYYNDLVSKPITLERWTDFKTRVLLLGTRVRKQHGSAKTANWRAAL